MYSNTHTRVQLLLRLLQYQHFLSLLSYVYPGTIRISLRIPLQKYASPEAQSKIVIQSTLLSR